MRTRLTSPPRASGITAAAGTRTLTGEARSADTSSAPTLRAQILRHTLNMIGAYGYANLRVEHVARVVGCDTTAILRHWSTRGALVAAALMSLSEMGQVPDTGDLVDDLVEHAWANVCNQQAMRGARVPHPVWSVLSEPDVYEHFRQAFLSRRRDIGLTLMQRSMDRGELSEDVDAHLILDTIAGLTLYRVSLQRERLSRAQLRPIIAALVDCPPLREDSPARDDLPADAHRRDLAESGAAAPHAAERDCAVPQEL